MPTNFSQQNKAATDLIFNERKKFIILGLTGRTGSGCTTVGNLLSRSFSDFSPPTPKSSAHFDDDEDRKYAITFNYLKNNWGSFYHIQLRNLITTFVLEGDFTKFLHFIEEMRIGENIKTKIDAEFIASFNTLHEQRVLIKTKTEEATLQSGDPLIDESVFKFYFELVPKFTESIKLTLNRISRDLYTKAYQKLGNNRYVSS